MNEINAALERTALASGPGYRCPDCKGPLVEADRTDEDGLLFIWHKCGQDQCSGRWLEKKIAAIRDY